jgi:hypothetical protein
MNERRKVMSDSKRIKTITILGIIGIIVGIIFGIPEYNWSGNIFIIFLFAFLGLLIGLGIASVPLVAGWIWRKVEGIRNFNGLIGLIVWFIMFYPIGLAITPIVSIYKFFTAKRDLQEDNTYEMQKQPLEIENKNDDWRDHF